MTYCLNPNCQNPSNNPEKIKFCQSCGGKLLLKDRYRALEIIGEGGFGRTFLAIDEDKPSKPQCVIKQFCPQALGSKNADKAAELFEQEARRLDELGSHPQIPELFAHFAQDGHQYLVQQFIDGKNLAKILTTEGAFTENQIENLLYSLLRVLDFIHSHNIIHRDIKPENIILSNKGQLVLVDFGAAKWVQGTALYKTGTVIGSVEYTAPEQTRGKATFASDIYSLAVTCIHLLTKINPFDLFSDSDDAWIWRDFLQNPLENENLGKILDKMLERATSRRFASAREVLNNLNAVSSWKNPSINNYKNLPNNSLPTMLSSSVSVSLPVTQLAPTQFAFATTTWQCIRTLTGHSNWVWSIAISPDGQTIASGSRDRTIKIWHLGTGRDIFTLTGHSNLIWSVCISPDGQTLVSGSEDKTIKIWQLGTLISGNENWQNFGIIPASVLSSPYLLYTWVEHHGPVYSVAISPDGKTITSGSGDKTIKIWQLGRRRSLQTLTRHSFWVRSVAFSPDGEIIASGGQDNTIHLWHINTNKWSRTLLGHSALVRCFAFTPDGEFLASASADKTIKIWHLDSGREIHTLIGHNDGVNSIAISPDGQFLVSGSRDKTIKIWHLSTGKEICTLTGHSAAVFTVTITPDGKNIVSGSQDTTIKIWRCN